MEVSVFAPLAERLRTGAQPYVGTLVGFVGADRLVHVLGCLLDQVEGGTPGVGSELLTALPGGLQPVGVAGCSGGGQHVDDVAQLVPEAAAGAVVVLTAPTRPDGSLQCALYDAEDGLVDAPFSTFSAEELRRSTLLLSAQATLTLCTELSLESLQSSMDSLLALCQSPTLCFVQPESRLLLRVTDANDCDPADEATCEQLASSGSRRAAAGELVTDCCFQLLQQATGLSEHRAASASALLIRHTRTRRAQIRRPLAISCLALLPRSAPLRDATSALLEALHRQLSQYRAVLSDVFSEKQRLLDASVHHFAPADLGHSLSIVYSRASTEEKLENYRRNVHAALLLRADRPMFRRTNSLRMRTDNKTTECAFLSNVHVGLSPPGTDAQVSVVQGRYTYHHYMQHGVDDDGWGCAYRSLQTLVSWFVWQGYMERDAAVPSHRAVQQCLVRIGDKPAAFVGSRQWIGSAEVGFCLNEFLQVESRLLHVSAGSEMGSHARDLLHHFGTEGTPVMIGGGVLAHTILGVSFNADSGEAHFLVLDPHYTGAEDLALIQKRGWCSWKPVQFWDQNAYYNMCMPIRPRCV